MVEIKRVVTDVDGVLTDGGFYYTADGKVMKRFGPHDSDGVKMLKAVGIDVYAITADARGFEITSRRLSDMGVPVTLVSESERLDFIESNFGFVGTVFIGDGWHDAPSLAACEISYAPLNATQRAIKAADHRIECEGGRGCCST